jgi:hypothetical protein
VVFPAMTIRQITCEKISSLALGICALVLFFALQGCGGGSPVSGPPPAPAPTFISIDAPNVGTSGFQGTYPTEITNAGDIVGYFYDSNNVAHGFLRTSGGVLTVIDAPGAGTLANQGTLTTGINSSGTIVGSFTDQSVPTKTHGFIRSSAGTYTPFDFPAASATNATGINDLGTVVGSYIIGTQVHGFVATNLGNLPNPRLAISFPPFRPSLTAAGSFFFSAKFRGSLIS